MSETQQTNWLPWLLVAGLAYFAFVRQPADKPIDPQPQPSQSISKVLEAAYEADRVSKIAVLKGIATGNFESDQAKLEWINSESEKRRSLDFRAYTERVAEAIEAGKTAELAERLEMEK